MEDVRNADDIFKDVSARNRCIKDGTWYNQFHKSQMASMDTISCLNGDKLDQFDFRFSERH
jgi:hypothetical protein